MTNERAQVEHTLEDLGVPPQGLSIAMREIDALVKLYTDRAYLEGFNAANDPKVQGKRIVDYETGYAKGYTNGREGYMKYVLSLTWIPDSVKHGLQNLEKQFTLAESEVKDNATHTPDRR